MTFEIKYLSSIKQIDHALWHHVRSPFLSRAFWQALEESGAISAETGWLAQHIAVFENGEPRACMPLFVKNHHRGEYVFDQAWARAYAEHGLEYYPRMVTSVPFSPIVGERIWLSDGTILADVLPYLLSGVQQLADQLNASSWHGLFLDEASVKAFSANNSPISIVMRTGCQFLWTNQHYADFNDFLSKLTAKRRKVIRAERRKISERGIECSFIEGASITPEDWLFFYQCYVRTYAVRGQKPYLSLSFFEQLGRLMPQSIVLQIAQSDGGERMAAALFFKDDTTLYGRYWGALYDIDCLHFEVCYYQGIDYAIAHHLSSFDPGTQGEHKLIRGFAPIYTQSVHWLSDARFMAAVDDFVNRERLGIEAYFNDAMMALPYRT